MEAGTRRRSATRWETHGNVGEARGKISKMGDN